MIADDIIDQTVDTNFQELYRLVSVYGAPEMVKSASASATGAGRDDLPNHLFADPGHRRFPVHSGPAAYVSMMYFLPQEASYGKTASAVRDRIERVAAHFGLLGEVQAFEAKFKLAQARPAHADLPDDDFALPGRGLPINDSAGVVKAAAYLREHREDLPLIARRAAAKKVLAKAAKVGGLSAPDQVYLERQAGLGKGDAKVAALAAYERARVLQGRGANEEALKLAEKASAVLTSPALVDDRSVRNELADLIDAADYKYRLRGLTAPEAMISFTPKQAAATLDDHVATTSGRVYRKADLEAVGLDELRGTFGPSFVNRVSAGGLLPDGTKLAAVLPTLTRRDAEMFDALAEEAGVSPVHVEPRSFNLMVSK